MKETKIKEVKKTAKKKLKEIEDHFKKAKDLEQELSREDHEERLKKWDSHRHEFIEEWSHACRGRSTELEVDFVVKLQGINKALIDLCFNHPEAYPFMPSSPERCRSLCLVKAIACLAPILDKEREKLVAIEKDVARLNIESDDFKYGIITDSFIEKVVKDYEAHIKAKKARKKALREKMSKLPF